MAELILKHNDLVLDILEHDSLLQNNEAEELNESDRNAAWEDYQKEKADINKAMESMNNQINNQLNSLTSKLLYFNCYIYFKLTVKACLIAFNVFKT